MATPIATNAGPERSVRSRRRLFVILGVALVGVLGLIGWWKLQRSTAIQRHFQTGRELLAVDRAMDAVEHFQECLRQAPGDSRIRLFAAQAARRTGDFEIAERLLSQIDDPLLAEDLALERVLLRANQGEVNEVRAFCTALIERKHPHFDLILEALTKGCINRYMLNDADAFLKQWEKADPERTQVLFLRALIVMQGSNQHETAAAFRRVLEKDPTRKDAKFLLAGILVDLVQAHEALPLLEELKAAWPEHLTVQVRYARCLDLLGRREEAESVLDGVLEKNPNYAAALVEKGRLLAQNGELTDAGKVLKRACEREPTNYPAHYQYYQCLKRAGRGDDAQAAFEKLGRIESDLERIRKISSDELSRRPADPDLHFEVGRILLESGSTDDGLRWLNNALRHDGRHAKTHALLAEYYEGIGQSGKAGRHRELSAGVARNLGPRP